jgi:tetraacyldisaccharide 4'-kinase
MLDPLTIEKLLGGQQRDVATLAMRGALTAASWGYGAAVAVRSLGYQVFPHAVRTVPVPVISVGNITAGGTGKTPCVILLARWLIALGKRVVIVSRGYGAHRQNLNDEAHDIAAELPEVPHIQRADRVAAAIEAVQRFGAEVVLLDDGFQHRRLHRNLDIVLLDALRPFGYGHLLPRGLLREPLAALARADLILLTRADLVDAQQRDRIWQVVERHRGAVARIELAYIPYALCAGPHQEPLHAYRRVAAFCGVGNPEAFHKTLLGCGYHVEAMKVFADHHEYSTADLDELTRWAQSLPSIDAVLCTRKDWVKINRSCLGSVPLRAVAIETHVLTGEQLLRERLARLFG